MCHVLLIQQPKVYRCNGSLPKQFHAGVNKTEFTIKFAQVSWTRKHTAEFVASSLGSVLECFSTASLNSYAFYRIK